MHTGERPLQSFIFFYWMQNLIKPKYFAVIACQNCHFGSIRSWPAPEAALIHLSVGKDVALSGTEAAKSLVFWYIEYLAAGNL